MKNKKIGNWIFISFIAIILITFGINFYNRNVSMDHDYRYTIAEVVKVVPLSRGGYHAVFDYKVNGNEYRSQENISKYEKSLIGKRFYVRYYTKKPRICEIYFNREVLQDLKNAPKEGWKFLP